MKSASPLDQWHDVCQSLAMEMTPKQHLAETLWQNAGNTPGLAEFCADQLDAGTSYRDLAEMVAEKMPSSIEVSRESLRRWYSRVPA